MDQPRTDTKVLLVGVLTASFFIIVGLIPVILKYVRPTPTTTPPYLHYPPSNTKPAIPPKDNPKNPSPTSKSCWTSGCSGQLCIETPIELRAGTSTTCEWKEEYACYKLSTCEVQPNGQCGWTHNPEFTACLNQANSNTPKIIVD